VYFVNILWQAVGFTSCH